MQWRFQSTPPCGGDTYTVAVILGLCISIHAPMRGRLHALPLLTQPSPFQSTPPCGGDDSGGNQCDQCGISIHAPMRGRLFKRAQPAIFRNFNPRPHAGATLFPAGQQRGYKFQSTPPCGGDFLFDHVKDMGYGFQSTPPCGGDRRIARHPASKRDFNPRPHAGAT